MGLRFRNRVGLGAGFDKDGVAHPGLGGARIRVHRARDGHASAAGRQPSATPLPPPGGWRPHQSHGLQQRRGRCAGRAHRAARPQLPAGFVVGVNIGRNRDGDENDYPAAARGGRVGCGLPRDQRQQPEHARPSRPRGPGAATRARWLWCREAAPSLPLVVKLSPDLTHNRRADIIRALPGRRRRDRQQHDHACGSASGLVRRTRRGGLSGAPLATAHARRDGGGAEDRRGSARDHRVRAAWTRRMPRRRRSAPVPTSSSCGPGWSTPARASSGRRFEAWPARATGRPG